MPRPITLLAGFIAETLTHNTWKRIAKYQSSSVGFTVSYKITYIAYI